MRAKVSSSNTLLSIASSPACPGAFPEVSHDSTKVLTFEDGGPRRLVLACE